MPIVNYEELARQSEHKFFSRKDISKPNKDVILRFMTQYDVKPATKNKFFKHIYLFLRETTNIQKDMNDRNLINNIFYKIRTTVSKGYYATIINVSKSLVRWLNDGELPKGFKDVKPVPHKDQIRRLSKEDMWTWENALELIKLSKSSQITAIMMTQLDAGFRPSEFVDLNYGDVEVFNDIISFRVREGKTGKRDVPCYRCASYFLRWYKDHPTKLKKDPLWITEQSNKSHKKQPNDTIRYEYPAILKRLRLLATKANIKKSIDFYNLRHSSCRLDKKENLPLELASKRHGHSVEFFTEVYGQEDDEERAKRLKKHYKTLSKANKEIKLNRVCNKCNYINKPSDDMCYQCNSPLTLEKALQMDKSKDLQEQLDKMNNQMLKIQNTLRLVQKLKK